jgi:hypothetical protein
VDGASPWASLRPLVQLSRSRGVETHLLVHDILRNPSGRRAIKGAGETFTGVSAFISPVATAAILARSYGSVARISRLLRSRANRASASIDEQESARLLAADLAAYPHLDLYVRQLRRAIRERRLDAVVTANILDSFLSATTLACRAEGTVHVCIQNACLERLRFPLMANCDLYLAESRQQAMFIRACGAHGPVEALGLPYYDELIAAQRPSRHALLELFPDLAGKILIGVTTQTAVVDFTPILEALIGMAERRGDVAIIIKLHPREDSTAYVSFERQLRRSSIGGRVKHICVEDFIGACDFLVSSDSTTIFWSILMGVQPFSWTFPLNRRSTELLDYLRPEVTFSSESPAVVVDALVLAATDPARREEWRRRREWFLQECISGCDGHAAERVFNRILSLIATGSQNMTVSESIICG